MMLDVTPCEKPIPRIVPLRVNVLSRPTVRRSMILSIPEFSLPLTASPELLAVTGTRWSCIITDRAREPMLISCLVLQDIVTIPRHEY